MPFRSVATRELADVLAVLAHPNRLRIIEEIGGGEVDVATLAARLDISSSGTSQHLAKLRAHRLVVERRDGRHVFYHLHNAALAVWLLDGLRLLERDSGTPAALRTVLRRARVAWTPR